MEYYFDTPKDNHFYIFEQLSKRQIRVNPNWGKSFRTERFILLYISSGKLRTAEKKSDL